MPYPKYQENSALTVGLDVNLLFVKRILSSAEILALFSTPVTLLPAIPGFIYIPKFAFFQKPAGTAYTIAGITQLRLRLGSNTILDTAPGGLLDTANAVTLGSWGPSSTGALTTASGISAASNLDLNITTTVANPTVGNTVLNVLVFYNLFPTTWNF